MARARGSRSATTAWWVTATATTDAATNQNPIIACMSVRLRYGTLGIAKSTAKSNATSEISAAMQVLICGWRFVGSNQKAAHETTTRSVSGTSTRQKKNVALRRSVTS